MHCRKLGTAQLLVSCFVSVSHPGVGLTASHSIAAGSHDSFPRLDAADLYSMPFRVRAHYVKVLLDWVATALTKTKHGVGSSADASTCLQQLSKSWHLLFVLLTSADIAPRSAPNMTLVAAAAAACKGCSMEHSSAEGGHNLALALQKALLVLNTKYKRSFRPGLEHR